LELLILTYSNLPPGEGFLKPGCQFDRPFIGGHSCYNLGKDWSKDRHGWWCNNSTISLLEKVEEPKIDFTSYQLQADKTAIYHSKTLPDWIYPTLGLSAEVGELQNKLKKIIRDNTYPSKDELIGELGDILWYLSQVATEFALSLSTIAETNLQKLKARQIGNKIHGEGDSR